MRRVVASIGVWLVGGLCGGVATGDPTPALPGSLLAAYTTRSQLDQHLGVEPLACAQVGAGREICTWALRNSDPAWAALAASIGTEDRINVICELPADGRPRTADSCSVHPRRSNRYAWKPMKRGIKSTQRVELPSLAQRQQRAAAMLEAARTALELSRLVGEGPSECDPEGDLVRCTWYATNKTEGHGTLMMVIDASPSKQLKLSCSLPQNGSPRGPDSCRVEVGARR